MKPLIYFIGRVINLLFWLIMVVTMVPIVYVLKVLWTFEPIKELRDIKEDLIDPPYDSERSGYVSWSKEKFWIRQTWLDFLLDRKTWIENPDYKAYLKYQNESKEKTVKNLKSDIQDVLDEY